MKTFAMGICLAAVATAASVSSCGKQERQNPFMQPYSNEFQIPPFEEIQLADY